MRIHVLHREQHRAFVQSDVETIFDHRARVLGPELAEDVARRARSS